MKRALVFLVAALALMVVPLGAAETSYTDATGDGGSVPDITSVTVSNTDAGVVTVRIGVPLAGNTVVATVLDTDRNRSTGSYGVDRVVMVGMSPSGGLVSLVLDGNGGATGTTVAAAYSAGVVQYSFPKETLSIDQGFDFWLFSASLDPASTATDDAPDSGWWTYELTKPAPPPPPPPVKPIIGKPTGTAAPVAGKKFTVSFPVTSSVDGQPLTTGTAECKTTVSGKTVPHTHTFKGGTVKAVVAVPKAAKGKQLKIAVKVTADTAATKVFTFKVK